MAAITGKLIVGDFSRKDCQGELHHPSCDKLLRLSLSPRMIKACVLGDCDSFSVHNSSQIELDSVEINYGQYAENRGNHVHLVCATWQENVGYDEEFGEYMESEFYGYIVEIKIDGVFINAIFGGEPNDEYDDDLDDRSRRRAENAFVMASVLIGVSVSRGLIVDN